MVITPSMGDSDLAALDAGLGRFDFGPFALGGEHGDALFELGLFDLQLALMPGELEAVDFHLGNRAFDLLVGFERFEVFGIGHVGRGPA